MTRRCAVPGAGGVGELGEDAVRLAVGEEGVLRLLLIRRELLFEPGVLGQADQVVDVVVVAPAQHDASGRSRCRPAR